MGSPLQAGGRHAFQRLAQHGGVILDGCHAMACEEVREEIHHRLAVLEHVGHAGRRAAIVLEDIELVLAHPDDIDSDDMGIDAARRVHADHLRHEGIVLDDDLLRDAAGPQDFLAVIEIMDEGVQRPDPLLDPGRQFPPLGGGEDPRDDVKGDEAL